jgi:Na+/proline symporter
MFWIIIIILQLVLWYLTFFKSKRIKKETKQDGYRTISEYVETTERFKFPLWSLLVGLLVSLIPIVGLIVFLWATIKVANMTRIEYEGVFDGNRPSFYIVKVFSREI